MPSYEVLYIDKFADSEHSRDTIKKMDCLFHIPVKAQQRLISGRPIVVKQHVDRVMAERFVHMIANAGGTSWVQEQSPFGFHVERRMGTRRDLLSRRSLRRDFAIEPDRRKIQERRVAVC